LKYCFSFYQKEKMKGDGKWTDRCLLGTASSFSCEYKGPLYFGLMSAVQQYNSQVHKKKRKEAERAGWHDHDFTKTPEFQMGILLASFFTFTVLFLNLTLILKSQMEALFRAVCRMGNLLRKS
jgi:hypothetical protein